jgi:hypothetical protein
MAHTARGIVVIPLRIAPKRVDTLGNFKSVYVLCSRREEESQGTQRLGHLGSKTYATVSDAWSR